MQPPSEAFLQGQGVGEKTNTKTAHAFSCLKKCVLFLCQNPGQNIQQCDYIPTPIAAKLANCYQLILAQYPANQSNVAISKLSISRRQVLYSSRNPECFNTLNMTHFWVRGKVRAFGNKSCLQRIFSSHFSKDDTFYITDFMSK